LAKAVFAREFFAGLHTQAATTTAICRASTTSVERAPRAACGRQRSELSMEPIMWTLIIITLLLVSGIYRIVTRCVARDRGALLRPGDAIFRPDGSMGR
jgi:hypothetical protein